MSQFLLRWFVRSFAAVRRAMPDRGGDLADELHSDAALETFHEACVDAKRRGGMARLIFEGIAQLFDLLRAIVRARLGSPVLVGGPEGPPYGTPTPKGAHTMWDDLRYATRRLRSRPGTALLCAVMLALAIGLTSAMFTVVDSYLLRPGPFRQLETFGQLGVGENADKASVNLPLTYARAWRSAGVFHAVHALIQQPATFGTGDETVTVGGARVTPGLLDDIGAKPIAGRLFAETEGRDGDGNPVVISESLWRSRFQADPSIVGRTIDVSGSTATVVGILPASFAFPYAQVKVWRPLDLSAPPAGLGSRLSYAYARFETGRSREGALAAAARIAHDVNPSEPDAIVAATPVTRGLLDDYSKSSLLALAVGVGLVFLVLCANATNLLLARLGARRQEFALCTALGASRARLLRQSVLEQLMLGLVASVAGFGVAAFLVTLASTSLPNDLLWRTLNPLRVDVRAVLGTSAFGMLAILVAGIFPAWLGTSRAPSGAIQDVTRSATPGRQSRRATTVLLVAEIAFAVTLSVVAGLQLRSFVNLLHEDRGLDADKLLTFNVTLPAAQFADGPSRYAAAQQIRAAATQVPGVESATLSFGVPPRAGNLYFFDVTSDVPHAAPVHLIMNGYNVEADFFAVYGIRLLQGRTFQNDDPPGSVVISQSLARALWPGASAIGHSFTFGKQRREVIGVAADIRNPSIDPRRDEPELYERLIGPTNAEPELTSRFVWLTVRCPDGCARTDAIRAAVKASTPMATVPPAKRVRDDYAASMERPQTGAVVAIAFAVIGLLAVGGGLFAVLTRIVQQRQREFGIRLALGATPYDVRRLVHRFGAGVAAVGLAAGVLVAWLVSRVVASVQYGVQLTDPLTWLGVVVVIGMTVMMAAWRPARRAMRLDPVRLLRED